MEVVTDIMLTFINNLIDIIRDGCRHDINTKKKNGHGISHVQEYTFRSEHNLQNKKSRGWQNSTLLPFNEYDRVQDTW